MFVFSSPPAYRLMEGVSNDILCMKCLELRENGEARRTLQSTIERDDIAASSLLADLTDQVVGETTFSIPIKTKTAAHQMLLIDAEKVCFKEVFYNLNA